VQGFWPIFFLAVILKIPVGLMLYLVYWAVKAQPETEEAPEGGAEDHEFRRWQRLPKGPLGPRRGPHAPDALPLPDCPPGGRRRVARQPAPVRVAGARAERGSVEPVHDPA
jgi:hypothetical protein